MAGPESDRREVCMDVAAWCVFPRSPELERHTACITWQGLDLNLGDTLFPADVVVENPVQSPEVFRAPESEAHINGLDALTIYNAVLPRPRRESSDTGYHVLQADRAGQVVNQG